MDDMNAFEHQIASVVQQTTRSPRPVDVMSIVRTTTAQSPKWRFQSMFSATKFVVAGVIVALFGGFLLSGVLTQQSEEQLPAAIATSSASPVAATDEPATGGPGTFSPAGTLGAMRSDHGAALLPDGRVLVVGGWSEGVLAAPAEIWDPATASFESAGSLVDGRGDPDGTWTILSDGRVLVVGGVDPWHDPGELPAEAEIWDPVTASFSPAGSPAGRFGHTATLLSDGHVLLAGGKWWDEDRDAWDSPTEVWDPATASFSPAGSLARTRYDHTATLLPDGRVLVIGGNAPGRGSGKSLSSAEVWDPATASFEPAGKLAKARWGHTATVLPDGRVLVVGGVGDSDPDCDPCDWSDAPIAEVWDPATASFSPAGSLSLSRRTRHTATLLPDGRVLVVGSGDEDMAEVWDPATASFSPAGSPDEARRWHTATLLPDGRVLVVGGENSSTAEVWSP